MAYKDERGILVFPVLCRKETGNQDDPFHDKVTMAAAAIATKPPPI